MTNTRIKCFLTLHKNTYFFDAVNKNRFFGIKLIITIQTPDI